MKYPPTLLKNYPIKYNNQLKSAKKARKWRKIAKSPKMSQSKYWVNPLALCPCSITMMCYGKDRFAPLPPPPPPPTSLWLYNCANCQGFYGCVFHQMPEATELAQARGGRYNVKTGVVRSSVTMQLCLTAPLRLQNVHNKLLLQLCKKQKCCVLYRAEIRNSVWLLKSHLIWNWQKKNTKKYRV
jgi:hypothetical protein